MVLKPSPRVELPLAALATSALQEKTVLRAPPVYTEEVDAERRLLAEGLVAHQALPQGVVLSRPLLLR